MPLNYLLPYSLFLLLLFSAPSALQGQETCSCNDYDFSLVKVDDFSEECCRYRFSIVGQGEEGKVCLITRCITQNGLTSCVTFGANNLGGSSSWFNVCDDSPLTITIEINGQECFNETVNCQCDNCNVNISSSGCRIRACTNVFTSQCLWPVTFKWEGPNGPVIGQDVFSPFNFSRCNEITAIGNGTYSVTMTDANGCTSTDEIEIEDCEDPCENNCHATIRQNDCTLTGSAINCGPISSMVWILPNGDTDDRPVINISVAGEYCLEVISADGCRDVTCIEIDDCDPSDCNCSNTNAVLEMEPYDNQAYPDCCSYKTYFTVDEGDCPSTIAVVWYDENGNLTGTANGSNYTNGFFQVMTTCTDGPFSSFETVEYYVNGDLCVTQDYGCCEEFEIELDHTDALCMMPNGAVGVIDHPQSDYTYNWERNGLMVGSTAIVECLPAGTYSVTVTDPDGCTATSEVTVNQVFSTTIISEDGGETGLAPDGNPIKSGLKFNKGQSLTWSYIPYIVPDEMILEWAPNSQFNPAEIVTLINTGPVTVRGSQCCTWQSINVCQCDPSTLLIADHVPGSVLPVDSNMPGPGIDILHNQASAFASASNSTNCGTNGKSITGCVTVPKDGWVRLLVNPDICMSIENTWWEVEVSCDCTVMSPSEQGAAIRLGIDTNENPLSEFPENGNRIYPNPSTGLIYFDLQNEVRKVEVYNSTGKLFEEKSGTIDFVDLSRASPGIYLFKLIGDYGTEIQKIVITR